MFIFKLFVETLWFADKQNSKELYETQFIMQWVKNIRQRRHLRAN